MATLTIRLPNDKHQRLRLLAKRRQVSMNKLMEELSTVALVQFDAEARFPCARGKRVGQEGPVSARQTRQSVALIRAPVEFCYSPCLTVLRANHPRQGQKLGRESCRY